MCVRACVRACVRVFKCVPSWVSSIVIVSDDICMHQNTEIM